jgi:tripartite ATP-independent transporter DctP family solute receptor
MERALRLFAFVVALCLSMGGFPQFFHTAHAEGNLRYAGDLPLGNHLTRGQEFFAQRVSEISKGQLTVQVFPAGQLFAAKDFAKVLPAGGVDMVQSLVSLWSGLVPAANFTEMPLFFDGWPHAWRVYDSEVSDILCQAMEKVGIKILFWMQDGKAGFATKSPLRTLEDFRGKRIRVPNELGSYTVKALGGAPAFMGGGEVYMALQRGTVDGGISSLTSFCDRKYYEVAKYVTEPNFLFGLYACMVNLNRWKALTSENQKVLLTAGKETQEWGRKEVQKVDGEALEELKKKGMEIYDLPKTEKDLWRRALKPIYDLVVKKAGNAGPRMFEIAEKAR